MNLWESIRSSVEIIVCFWSFTTLIGFFLYCFDVKNAKTLEDGIAVFVTALCKGIITSFLSVCKIVKCLKQAFPDFLYFLSGTENPKKMINYALMLANEEVLELVRGLDRHPYDTPTLVSYIPNRNNLSQYEISAAGLVSAYHNLTNIDTATIAYNVIQNYIMETRNIQACIHIQVATSKRLCFSIALSEESSESLIKQPQADIAQNPAENPAYMEEEIIDFSEDSDTGEL